MTVHKPFTETFSALIESVLDQFICNLKEKICIIRAGCVLLVKDQVKLTVPVFKLQVRVCQVIFFPYKSNKTQSAKMTYYYRGNYLSSLCPFLHVSHENLQTRSLQLPSYESVCLETTQHFYLPPSTSESIY